MKAVHYPETSATVHRSARCNGPEDLDRNRYYLIVNLNSWWSANLSSWNKPVCKREEAFNSGLISFMWNIGRRFFVTAVAKWLLQILKSNTRTCQQKWSPRFVSAAGGNWIALTEVCTGFCLHCATDLVKSAMVCHKNGVLLLPPTTIDEQDKQRTCNLTKYYTFCVCVCSLRYPASKHMRCVISRCW